MRTIMAEMLAPLGHTVIETKSAREALRVHEAEPVDLIITDLVMKDMDGIELLRRVRNTPKPPPVIGVSGNRHSTIYLNMAKMIGAEHILAKPFPAEALQAAVSRALGLVEKPA